MKKTHLFLLLLVCSFSFAGLISHHEFQGNFKNSITGGGDGAAVNGAKILCADPNETSHPITLPTLCKADLSGDKWIHIGYPGLLSNVATFQKITMAMWVKTNSSLYAQLLGRRYEWRLYVQNGAAAMQIGTLTLLGQTSISDGKWHHVVATYDGSSGEACIYVDGVLDASKTQSDPLIAIESGLRAAIGGVADSASGASFIFNGYVDDVRVYDEILSLADVVELYEFTDEPFCLNQPTGDFDGDCKVGIDDLAVFLSSWLEDGWE